MRLALYRKYRPQGFDELKGQSAVRQTLSEALKQGRLSHAYLFAGPRGTGKTSTARLIAKAIQCESPTDDGQACGACSVCEMNANGNLVDLVEIDAASNRGIDEIRDLREKIRFAPTHAKSKVYIIDEVHMLTKEAFNALLKSLEEPPEHVYFILATTELHKIPETIVSRCQRYDFKRISVDSIVDRLEYIVTMEKLSADKDALKLLAEYADGGMRDAISLLEQFSSEAITGDLVRDRLGLSHEQSCHELYSALGNKDSKAALKVIEDLHSEGYNLQQFTLNFLGYLRAKLHEAVHGGNTGAVHLMLKWTHLFDEAWVKLKQASIAQLPLEIACIRATHPRVQGHVEPTIEAPVQAVAPLQEIQEKAQTATVSKAPVTELKTPVETRVETPVKAVTPAKKAPVSGDLKSHLNAIYKKIGMSSVRLSFKTGSLESIDGTHVSFTFNSRFHYDKVNHGDAIEAIEAAILEVTGVDYKLHLSVGGSQIRPKVNPVKAVELVPAPAPVTKVVEELVEQKNDSEVKAVDADKIADELGWELVEDEA